MKLFKTIEEYHKELGIKPPAHPHFEIRRFEDNSETIKTQMPAFRHQFYFIAVRDNGFGKVISGHNTHFPNGITVYFNTPFQVQSWDIDKSWGGYYIIFSQEFLNNSRYFDTLLDDFPFLKIDATAPFEIEARYLPNLLEIYTKIKEEFESEKVDRFQFINLYVLQLLNQIKRLLNKNVDQQILENQIKKADSKLLSNFQDLIASSFCCESKLELISNPHSPSFFAHQLNVHPNHLNKVVKAITGQTAQNQIQSYILKLAKIELVQTTKSSKEIAYNLHFSSPAKFSDFFKKQTGESPINYRKKAKE
ncbi:MAG: helix-turn-helix domain-containing protein [Marinifilaceae bacterium]|jgi:AraC-like DNA-binding protein|nr:helix-turn-helix domain-containing protein [Marinifilaceae bacterium]